VSEHLKLLELGALTESAKLNREKMKEEMMHKRELGITILNRYKSQKLNTLI